MIVVSLAGFSITIGWGLSPKSQPIITSILVWVIAITPIVLSYVTIKQFNKRREIGRKLYILISLLAIPLEILMLIHMITESEREIINWLNVLLVLHLPTNLFFIYHFSKKSTKTLFIDE